MNFGLVALASKKVKTEFLILIRLILNNCKITPPYKQLIPIIPLLICYKSFMNTYGQISNK